MSSSSNEMISVFLSQEQVGSQREAEEILREAQREGCIGGRVIPPSRQNKHKWTVQTCYEATAERAPLGMAKLMIPRHAAGLAEYGIERPKKRRKAG